METGNVLEAVGPPWLVIIIAGISLLGVVITAVVGPMIVERFRSTRAIPESPESSAIEHRISGAVTLIESAIADLRIRMGRLETMLMTDAHEHRG